MTVRLRIASFNIRNGRALDGRHLWWLRRRATLEAIRALDADVIGLQEAYRFQLRWLTRRLPAYTSHGAGRRDGSRGEWCPILVRSGIDVLGVVTRWYGESPDEPGTRLAGAAFPRIATIATLSMAGRAVQVVNTHVDEADASRRLQSAQQLLTWLDRSIPTVVVGDLNATTSEASVRSFVDAGFQDALEGVAGGTAHRFTGGTDGRRIDHVLVDRHWTARAARIAATPAQRPLPSDHWPVVADLELA